MALKTHSETLYNIRLTVKRLQKSAAMEFCLRFIPGMQLTYIQFLKPSLKIRPQTGANNV